MYASEDIVARTSAPVSAPAPIETAEPSGYNKQRKIQIEKTFNPYRNMQVGILMGSDSDWAKISSAAKALEEFGIAYEINVMSAHRTPDHVKEYAETAVSRGLSVIICAAGGAAHLAGVVASHTILPVIGIPVPTDLAGGLDSLLSTVQMPGDIPVAAVGTGTGGARNAGLLAVQILAVADAGLRKKLEDYRQGLVKKIAAKNAALKQKIAGGEW
ncbi:MAG: 5-(carboxyamino)imidazole ribonucleotide mutase [Planctomycetaceae bacterium]|jgi:5-(carboxyamino)imidazole ribonucleotide mutase|nr:5-(carboxyamino)imidazole ribonucleotide mutase [Planctomycetaceae bacterium]